MANSNRIQGKGSVIVAAKGNAQMVEAEILGAHYTPKGNIVLEFADNEVIMPAGWRSATDLCVGDNAIAYWDEDGKFHLEVAC